MLTVKSNFRWPSRPKSTSSSRMCSKRPSSASLTRAPRPLMAKSCRERSYRRTCLKLQWCDSVHHKSNFCWRRTRRNPSLKKERKSRSIRNSPRIPSAAISSPRKLSRRRLQRQPQKSQLRRSKLQENASSWCRRTQLRWWRRRRRTASQTSSTTSSETLQCSVRTLRWSKNRLKCWLGTSIWSVMTMTRHYWFTYPEAHVKANKLCKEKKENITYL